MDLCLTAHQCSEDFASQFPRCRNLSPLYLTLLLRQQVPFCQSASYLHNPVAVHQIQAAVALLSVALDIFFLL